MASPRAAAFLSASSTIPRSSKFAQIGGPHGYAVFANAAGEHDRIGTAEFDQVRAQVMPHRADEHVERQFRALVSAGSRLFQIADVAARAAQPEQTASALPGRPALASSDLPVACITTGIANGSKSPTRLFCGKPDCGLIPMLVATLFPPRMAHSELDPPKWHEMIRISLRPSEFRHPRGDIPMTRPVKTPAANLMLFRPIDTEPNTFAAAVESSHGNRFRMPPQAEFPAASRSSAASPRCTADYEPAPRGSFFPSPITPLRSPVALR